MPCWPACAAPWACEPRAGGRRRPGTASTMKAIALLILVSAWGCLLFAPSGIVSRVLQMLVFGALGV